MDLVDPIVSGKRYFPFPNLQRQCLKSERTDMLMMILENVSEGRGT